MCTFFKLPCQCNIFNNLIDTISKHYGGKEIMSANNCQKKEKVFKMLLIGSHHTQYLAFILFLIAFTL